MSSPTPLRTLYRNLLRELPPRPLLSNPRAPLHQRLRERFEQQQQQQSQSQSQSQQQQEDPQSIIAQAEQYLAYLRAQRTYVTLLERYNPGMALEQDEKVRLTARRVGMNLPKTYGEEEGEGK